jgi:Pyruvate kinase, barrel domain
MPLPCNAKIVATLGPSSADRATIEALVRAGADVFRLNFSHGTHADHQQRLELIRSIEADIGRPIGVLLDLQGPKLRVGTFATGVSQAHGRAPSRSATVPIRWPRLQSRVIGDIAVSRSNETEGLGALLVHALVAHRIHAASVQPVEIDAVVGGVGVQAHRDVYQAEADDPFQRMRELMAMAGCGHLAQREAAHRRLWPYLTDHRLARRRALLGAAQQAFDDEAIVLDDFA